MDTTELATYLLLAVAAGGMIYVINQMRQRNLRIAAEQNAPKIAGEDELEGQALDPGQFSEPDDDALDEMEQLLKDAAESQGLDYIED